MPIYEFKCKGCLKQFEQILKINEVKLPLCPHCQSQDTERLISAPGFQLKGGGWYVTDFKDNKKQESVNKDKKDD